MASNDTLAKLVACPFCGDEPKTIERPDNIDGTEFFYAVMCYCGGYSATAHKMAIRKTPEQAKADAVEAWNRRALTAQALAEQPDSLCFNLSTILGCAPSNEDVIAAAQSMADSFAAQALPAAEPVGSGDWTTPTTHLQRFGDAMQLLCAGHRPPDPMLLAWMDKDSDSFELQEFAIAHGPAWAQGIGIIDAALVAAENPTEGVEHDMAAQQAAQATAGWQPIETAPKNGGAILIANDAFVSQGYWVNAVEDAPDEMGHDAGFVDCFHNYFYCSRSFGNEQYMNPGNQPTHWQPLPAPPAALPQPQPQSAQAKGDA